MAKLATPLKKQALVESFMREAIFTAAKKVLAANGYDRTALDQIAQEAEVSKGSIYVYFRSKEELLGEVLQGGMHRFIEASKAAAAREQTPWAQLKAVVHTHLQSFAADPDTFKIALTERTNVILNPRSQQDPTLWQMYQEHVEWVGVLFQQAIQAGEIRPIATQRYAHLLLDAVFMAAYRRLATPTSISLAQEAEEIMDVLLWGLSTGDRPVTKKPK
ncbi:MAG: TetR/AcrR family transcriptional regulator [Candidatus Binatia bacterium]